TQTIALIDAYGYAKAEEDLAKYRERYGLEPCTTANGCFKKVNEVSKEEDYPPEGEGWELEQALDIDMASAACPHCHIVLVEAASNYSSDLGSAANIAAEKLGATTISNSYGLPEEDCAAASCEEFNADYDHPGVMVTASAGDSGYDNELAGAESPQF